MITIPKPTKKIQTASSLTTSQRLDLKKLKEKGHIKSVSDGIRTAVSEWLRNIDLRNGFFRI